MGGEGKVASILAELDGGYPAGGCGRRSIGRMRPPLGSWAASGGKVQVARLFGGYALEGVGGTLVLGMYRLAVPGE